jgi:hypothetical protein
MASLTEPARSKAISAARLAGWSGIAFAVLSIVALALVYQIPGLGVPDSAYTQFYTSSKHSVLIVLGLYVVPFAGIAFLWHLSASRVLIRALDRAESDIPHWLYVTSGVVFVCMMFAGSAAVGAVALLTVFSTAPLPSVDVARALSSTGYALMFVYGVRAAGMFMITGTRLARATGMLPGWLAVITYLVAAFLLVNTTFHPGVLLVFPVWIAVMSVFMLLRARTVAADTPVPPQASLKETTA